MIPYIKFIDWQSQPEFPHIGVDEPNSRDVVEQSPCRNKADYVYWFRGGHRAPPGWVKNKKELEWLLNDNE